MAKKRGKTSEKPDGESTVAPALAPVVEAFARQRDVTYGGKGFGSTALKVDGKIFAMLSSKGEFVLKLPKNRVDEIVRLGRGDYFDPGHGRVMKEWLVLRGAKAAWIDLAREAYRFVKGRAS